MSIRVSMNTAPAAGSPGTCRSPAFSRAQLAFSDAIAAAKKSTWLSAQPVELQQDLLCSAAIQKFTKGQQIIEFDESGSALFFLLKGTVEVSVPKDTLELHPIHLLPSLHWFGEHSVVRGKRSYAEYSARNAVSVIAIPRTALNRLESTSAYYRAAAMELLLQVSRNYLELAGDFIGHNLEDRVRARLYTLSAFGATSPAAKRVVLPICQEELAVLCCVSRGTVCKILRQLEQAGIIEVGYGKIVVGRRGALLA